jgi:hypothetical protein
MNLEQIEIEMIQWIAETKKTRRTALNLALEFSQVLQEQQQELAAAESSEDEQRMLRQMSHVERTLSNLRLDVEQLSGVINHGQQWLEKIEAGDKAGALSDVEMMKRIAIDFDARKGH